MSDDMHLIKIRSGFFLCRSLIHKKSYLDDPEQIRTADLPLRRRTLYPAELQDHATYVTALHYIFSGIKSRGWTRMLVLLNFSYGFPSDNSIQHQDK